MPVTPLPDLSENPGAVFGTGDLAICNPVELENGCVALLLFEVPPAERAPDHTFQISLADRKASLALVFSSIDSVDQVVAALAEVRGAMLESGGGSSAASSPDPLGQVGRHLSVKRLRRELQELVSESSFFDPQHGTVLPTSELRRYLDNLHRGRA